jgi:hypothetical protein
MLALCRSSRQIVVADEELDGTDMVGELLGKGQRLAHQTGHTLAQRVVEAFDVIGFTGQFADRSVLCGGYHPICAYLTRGCFRVVDFFPI